MLQFSIGLSALQTAQQGLAIAGNNIANASTPGYHRESANEVTLPSTVIGGVALGTGVGISTVNRAVSQQLDNALTQQTSQNGFTDASLTASTQIQQAVSTTGTTSPATQLEGLLNSIEALSSSPSSWFVAAGDRRERQAGGNRLQYGGVGPATDSAGSR